MHLPGWDRPMSRLRVLALENHPRALTRRVEVAAFGIGAAGVLY